MGDPLFFEERDLGGGAKLFHQYRPGMPWCGIGAVIVAGHMHDPVGKEGLSHLLEHQVSNGRIGDLPAMPIKDLQNWLHRRRLSASLGTTSNYWTRYGGRAENFQFGDIARFLTDLIFRPGFDGDFEKEREAVRAERGHRLNDRRTRIAEAVERSAFGTHRRTTATGLPDDAVLDGLTHQDVIGHHRKYYTPPNVRFVTLGGIDTDDMRKLLGELVPPVGPDAIEVGRIPPLDLKPPDPRLLRFSREDGRPATTVRIKRTWRFPMIVDDTDTAAKHALDSLLLQRLREELRLVYGVGAECSAHFDHASFSIHTKVDAAKADLVLDEIERIMRDESGLREAFARKDHLLRPDLVIYDRTCGAIIDHALSSVTDLGYVATRSEALRVAEAVTETEVLDFVRDRLSLDMAQTVIVEQQ